MRPAAVLGRCTHLSDLANRPDLGVAGDHIIFQMLLPVLCVAGRGYHAQPYNRIHNAAKLPTYLLVYSLHVRVDLAIR